MQGAARVWCFAPGYFDGGRVASADAMRRLTGFTLQPATPQNAWATPTAVGRRLGLTQAFGIQSSIKPLLAATDATASEALAIYPDDDTGTPAAGETVRVLHVCKGNCDHVATEKFGDAGGTDELSVFIARLAHNAGMRLSEMKSAFLSADLLNQI